VLVLTLLIFWSATSALFRLNDAWQLAVILPTMLGLALLIYAIEKSRIHHSQTLQVKLDQLIRAAEYIQNSILDLEKLSKAESLRVGSGFADWSPQAGENGHTATTRLAHANGHRARHHSGTAHLGRNGAGAHRITPTGKA
jgi:low affinity Fe/Cu permease